MGTSARATTSSAVYTTPAFWERFWRTGGIQSIACFILAYFIYGDQPRIGTAADALVAFYNGDRKRILIAAVFFGLAVLNLTWFAAALKTTLADAGLEWEHPARRLLSRLIRTPQFERRTPLVHRRICLNR